MSENLGRVELRGVVVDLHRRVRDHHRTLLRELALVHAADRVGAAPARLLWLDGALRSQVGAFGRITDAILNDAGATGRTEVDLAYDLDPGVVGLAEQLTATLDEIEQLCERGELLTAAAPPDLLAYRRWVIGEVVAQIRDGRPPTPWHEVAPTGDPVQTAATPGQRTHVAINDDLDLQGAAGLRLTITSLIDSGTRHIDLDLDGCSFIDSVGVSLLLTTWERLRASGGSLLVTNVAGAAARTLEIAGVMPILTGRV